MQEQQEDFIFGKGRLQYGAIFATTRTSITLQVINLCSDKVFKILFTRK